MPVPLLIAAGAGGVLGAKALVGLGIAGGTAIGVSIAAAWRFYLVVLKMKSIRMKKRDRKRTAKAQGDARSMP